VPDDDAQGQPIEVLWEIEWSVRVRVAEDRVHLIQRGFDPAAIFAVYLNSVRWRCVTATEVGLGKTVEVGLSVRERMLRKNACDLGVSCSPFMLPQWMEEQEARFGPQFEILDKEFVHCVRRWRGF
jgi:hypothetical protein